MAWMPCNIRLDRWRRCVISALFVAPIKSSTNASMMSLVFYGMVGCRDVGIMIASKNFQGSVVFYFTRSDIMSLAVSDPAQKKGVPCSFWYCAEKGWGMAWGGLAEYPSPAIYRILPDMGEYPQMGLVPTPKECRIRILLGFGILIIPADGLFSESFIWVTSGELWRR